MRDERDTRSGDEPAASPEWSVEDFDDFAPFDDESTPAEDEPQALEFGFLAEDEPIPEPADPATAEVTGERGPRRDPDAAIFDIAEVDRETSAEDPGADRAASDEERDDQIAASDETLGSVAPGGGGVGDAADGEASGAPDIEVPTDPAGAASPRDEGDEPAARSEPAAAAAVPIEKGKPGDDDTAEDTIETGFEGGEAAGAAPTEEDDEIDVPDFASFTSEQYVQTTTQEFVDLAADMERASRAEHEQSAITAEIPGLESGLVGLDDVVAASGTDPSAIPVAQRSNLALRVFTGLALAFIFFASLYDPLFIGLFVFFVLTLSAGEFYSALVRAGHRPVGLFGVLGTVGALGGTWVWGPIAVPVALAATLAVTLLFFGVTADRRDPMTNTALTVLGTAWVGGTGAFVFEILEDDDYGWLILATVLTVALMDIASYFVGRRVGRHKMAPRVSPKKTVEGLIGGMLVALLVGVAFGLREPFDLGTGLLLGAIVAVVAPLGDLAVSLMKRAIGLKDMGTLLPGHGGLLDRIDAMLFVIPPAWIAFLWTGLLS